MNKSVIMAGIVVPLFIILSGCNQFSGNQSLTLPYRTVITGDTDKIEIVNFSIQTQKGIDNGYEKIADGFVYTEYAKQYVINGTAKNTAGRTLSNVEITVKFYDVNGSHLSTKKDSISNLTETWDFRIIYFASSPYFKSIDHIKIEISAN